jgi:hypothetical protein
MRESNAVELVGSGRIRKDEKTESKGDNRWMPDEVSSVCSCDGQKLTCAGEDFLKHGGRQALGGGILPAGVVGANHDWACGVGGKGSAVAEGERRS